ncbi:MAG: glycosyltransferase, partial [Actinobacteria bacterium]|nr:glycosyltransferase [Actinomycetota bacterium]
LGGSPIRLFSLTPAGAALMDRIELSEPFEAGPAERDLINRWQDAGLLHPQPDLGAAVSPSPQVTLVVPVRDRAEGAQHLLASIAADQSAAAAAILEILIVDDGSDQPLIVETAGQRLPTVRVIRIEQSVGPAQARNLGLRQVSTELVAFVDSDCQVTPNWLAPLLGQIADPFVVAAAPRVKAVLPLTSQTPASQTPASQARLGQTSTEQTRAGGLTALEQYELSRSPLDLGKQAGRVQAGTRVSYVPSAAVLMRTELIRQAASVRGASRDSLRAAGLDSPTGWLRNFSRCFGSGTSRASCSCSSVTLECCSLGARSNCSPCPRSSAWGWHDCATLKETAGASPTGGSATWYRWPPWCGSAVSSKRATSVVAGGVACGSE